MSTPRDPRESAPIVYSTQGGQRCRSCGQVIARCACRSKERAARTDAPDDGKVRVRRETKGRGGKTVTTISGAPGDDSALRELAGELKRLCGCGGALKAGVIEIQGDHCERILAALQAKGMRAIRSGG